MSLATAVIGLVGALSVGLHSTWFDPLLVFSVCSLSIGVTALVPGRWTRSDLSDGDKLRRLTSSPQQARQMCALAVLAERRVRAIRPRDWEASLLIDAVNVQDGSIAEAEGCSCAYYHAFDSGDLPTAKTALQRLRTIVQNLPLRHRSTLQRDVDLEAAYLSAASDGDLQAARQYLANVPKCKPLCFQRARAEAAVLAADGQPGAAWDRVTALAAQIPVPYMREWLERAACHQPRQ